MRPIKKDITTKAVIPPLIAAANSCLPTRDKNRRSINSIAVYEAFDTTIGRAMWRMRPSFGSMGEDMAQTV